MTISDSIKKDFVCLLIVCFFGALISTLPHLIWFCKSGSLIWIADYDELGVYLPISSQSYFNHVLWFSDPAIVTSGPTSFPWMQMFPGHFLNWALGFSPANVLFVWRLLAGISIAAGWFLLFRQIVSSRSLAIIASLWLLYDAGILKAQPLVLSIRHLISAGWDDKSLLLSSKPLLHPQWRLITPGLSWFYLSLFLIAMVVLQKKINTKKAWVLPGVAFALQFYSYFYFWTTCGLGLLLAIVFDRDRRAAYFKIGLLGLILGLPAIIKDSLIKTRFADDWLLRADRFLPIDRFSELLFPKTGIILALITFFIVRYRHKDLTWMWCQVVAGLFLLNHQIITGLQIENFHWTYAWAPILTILLVSIGIREVEKKNWLKKRPLFIVLICILSFHIISGLWLRAQEATKSLHTLELKTKFDNYQIQKAAANTSLNFDPKSSLAGENWYMNYAMSLENVRPLVTYTTIFSPSVDNNELYERTALNAILSAKTFETYHQDQMQILESTPWGPWQRDLVERKKTLTQRLEIFKKVQNDVPNYIKKFNVQHLALLVGESPITSVKLTLLQQGPTWNIWKIE